MLENKMLHIWLGLLRFQTLVSVTTIGLKHALSPVDFKATRYGHRYNSDVGHDGGDTLAY